MVRNIIRIVARERIRIEWRTEEIWKRANTEADSANLATWSAARSRRERGKEAATFRPAMRRR